MPILCRRGPSAGKPVVMTAERRLRKPGAWVFDPTARLVGSR